VEYCRHRNHESGRCDPHLSTLAQNLDRTYSYVSDCKTELVKKNWLTRSGKNAVELLVGFPPPKVRQVTVNPKYVGRRAGRKNPKISSEKSEDKFGNFPKISSGGIRTQVREESELGAASPITEPGIEPVAAEAAASAAASPPAPDRGTEVCTDEYVAEVRTRGHYPPDFVDFVWRKLRDTCEKQSRRLGYPVPPIRRQFDWWLDNELTPPQQSLLTGAGRTGDVRLGAKQTCDATCSRCFGTGMWYPGGFERGVARCPGPAVATDERGEEAAQGLKVVNGCGVE
jgi:hypothetical protein